MFSMTLKQWRESIRKMFVGVPKKEQHQATGRKERPFAFIFGGQVQETISALTKSEARAKYKAAHNLDRVPVGMTVE